MTGARPLLQVDCLVRHFGGVKAIDGLSLDVHEGEIVGLIGPNGAGKTTAFNLISGAIRPFSGRVVFDGRDLRGLRPSAIVERGLARTFQHSSVFARATVLENVLRGALVRHQVPVLQDLFGTGTARRIHAAARDEALALLQLTSLSGHADDPASTLSYGNQRRLGVAIALASRPRLLMLDEPAAGLNPEETLAFGDLVRSIVRERGLAVVLVEHHMRLVMGLCDRIVVLERGRKIAEGTPRVVQSDPAVIAAYLGSEDDDA